MAEKSSAGHARRKEGKGEVEHKADDIYKEEEASYDEQRNGKPREKGLMR